MKNALSENAALHMPDYAAAQDANSGRPLELYVDACEYGWGCTLAQRARREGAPRPIACFSKSFSPTEQAWSTFERELNGLKESLTAVDHLIKGFPVIVYTDHKNNLFTGSLLANKRMQKKLLRWTLEIEELGTLVQRVWLAGKDNVLGDAPSRNPADRDRVKDLPVPAGPVKRVVRAMFEAPIQFDDGFEQFNRFLDQLESTEPDHNTNDKTNETTTPPRPADHGRAEPPTPPPINTGDDSTKPTDTGYHDNQLPINTGDRAAPKDCAARAPPDSHDTATTAEATALPADGQWSKQEPEGHTSTPADPGRLPGAGNAAHESSDGASPTLTVSASTPATSWPGSLDAEILAQFCADDDYHGDVSEATTARSWLRTNFDAVCPRYPMISFLPLSSGGPSGAGGAAAEAPGDKEVPVDPRLPVSDTAMPSRIYFSDKVGC